MAAIEFWYEFGSTYSYPAAMRVERLAVESGVSLRWRVSARPDLPDARLE
jgi:2-hydroxychromene-2-carboxylate isomerase